MRKTVANMFENAECPEGVAADVVGHLKPTMTYGLYSGITKMDLRARWMEKAIRYPTITDVRHPAPGLKRRVILRLPDKLDCVHQFPLLMLRIPDR